MHILNEIDKSYLRDRVRNVEVAENLVKTLQNEVSSLIQLICKQNDLEGNWQLNIDNWSLNKVEEKENA